MRILIVSVDYPPIEGGIATVCLNLARECAAMGHDTRVLAPDFPGMADFDAAEPYAVARFGGYRAGWLRLAPFLRAAWPLTRDTDLVIAVNVAYGGVLGRLALARRGTPYVCLAYAYEFLKFAKAPPARALLRDVYRNAAATVAISEFTARNLIAFGAPAGRVRVALPGAALPGAPDGARIAAIRERLGLGGDPYVLSVGRVIPRKNQAALVAAWPAVRAACPGARLVIAGRGPERESCAALAARLRVDGAVCLPGYLDAEDLAALYADCAFFALPNGEDRAGQVEGFGLVFAEAAAYGKAVIGGDSGGAREAIRDGETGLLVPPGDGPALEAALVKLLRDDALRERLGAAGRARIHESLNWPAFTRAVLDAASNPARRH